MKNFLKTVILLFLTTVVLKSCESNETVEDIISDEQSITTDLADKIIATATTIIRDIDLINFGCNATLIGYFRDYQGEQISFTIDLENWDNGYPELKQNIFLEHGFEFTDDDFFLTAVDISLGGQWPTEILYEREQWINYFEDCSYDGTITNTSIVEKVYISEINYNCSGSVTYLADGNIVIPDVITSSLSSGIGYLEDLLGLFNLNNNTNYTIEDVYIEQLTYVSLTGHYNSTYSREDMLNYFEDCVLNREPNTNCLNFVYPLKVNRFNLQLEEVITTTIENDEDLTTTFNTDIGELEFVFPINLLGQNGTVVTIDTNDALEIALDSAATYCE